MTTIRHVKKNQAQSHELRDVKQLYLVPLRKFETDNINNLFTAFIETA